MPASGRAYALELTATEGEEGPFSDSADEEDEGSDEENGPEVVGVDEEDLEMVAVDPKIVSSHDPLAPHLLTGPEANFSFALRTQGEKGAGDPNNNVPELTQVINFKVFHKLLVIYMSFRHAVRSYSLPVWAKPWRGWEGGRRTRCCRRSRTRRRRTGRSCSCSCFLGRGGRGQETPGQATEKDSGGCGIINYM